MKDLIERVGITDFVKALVPYSQDAADEDLDLVVIFRVVKIQVLMKNLKCQTIAKTA